MSSDATLHRLSHERPCVRKRLTPTVESMAMMNPMSRVKERSNPKTGIEVEVYPVDTDLEYAVP